MTAEIPTKRCRVLRRLLIGPANRFQLERDARDHCPASTVSELRADGLGIDTEIVAVPGYCGRPAYIARYSLAECSRARAVEMLRQPRKRSGRGKP